MDDFDDEPGTGGSYEDAFALPLYIRTLFRTGSSYASAAASSTSRSSWKRFERGITGTLIRYDDAHDRFHRHHPSWPQPADIAEFLAHIEQRQRVAYARDEIRSRYTTWEAAVFGKEPQ